MIRVMVVDDQALMRTGFRLILESETDIEVVAEAEDGLRATELCTITNPDVVLMDIRMPNLNGIEATRKITSTHPNLRVLILTTFDLDEYVFEAVRAGASGFLLKDTPPEQLVDAIRIVAGGDALMSPGVTRTLIAEFARQPALQAPSGVIAELTDRELQVLQLLAKGLSNAEIAAELILGETTIKTHVSRILMKLGVRDRVQAVITAYEAGVAVPGLE